MSMYPGLSQKRFAEHVGSEFTVLVESNRTVSLTLCEVKELGSRQAGEHTIESYSLLFEGPTAPMLAQSSFEFVHADLGELIILIAPLGPRSGVMLYEAVFN